MTAWTDWAEEKPAGMLSSDHRLTPVPVPVPLGRFGSLSLLSEGPPSGLEGKGGRKPFICTSVVRENGPMQSLNGPHLQMLRLTFPPPLTRCSSPV